MSRSFRFPFLAAAALAGSLALVVSAQPPPPSASLQKRIDALLKQRLKPEQLPVNPPNPFQLTTGVKRESGAADELGSKPAVVDETPLPIAAPVDAVARELAASPAEILVSCATRLKFGGIIILKDQIHIVVNGVPRKEGDPIAADWNNTIVTLRIARLMPGQLILRYGEAEVTVKF